MFEGHLRSLKANNLLRALRVVEPNDGVRAVIGGRECTLFCSNDYLGLSGHPRVKAEAKAAIDEAGFGSGAAPLISGNTVYHNRLAEELAGFKRSEAALVFGSGYLANVGIIPALASEGDVIISDGLNHASIIDGCRLSRAEVKVYRHGDMGSLEQLLRQSQDARHRWVITEGVFSMDGDIAPLPEITALSQKHGASVILDDAHATGTIGGTGRGTLEHFGLDADNVIQMGTLGKALGSYGAFVAAPRETADWLTNSARSFMFSTALPAPVCAAASAALQVIKEGPDRLSLLRKNADCLRLSLIDMGLDVLGGGTPIITVVTGDAERAVKLASSLLEAGYYAPAIRPPTVPEGLSRIRITVSSLHTDNDISGLLEAMERIC